MRIENKRVLITGSTDGIGKQTALETAALNAEVIIHGRNKGRVFDTVQMIKMETGNENIHGFVADFKSLAAVNSFAEELNKQFETIDILFNNAAEILPDRILTEDGYERQFQVNYLAHFLLTHKLLPLIKASKEGRILNVSSMIHATDIDFENLQGEKEYSGSKVYALTKLLNILHANKLADELADSNIAVHSLHPGVISTKLLNTAWQGGAPLTDGAANLIYAATSEVAGQNSGYYLENRRPMQSNPISYDRRVQDKLWELSIEFTKDFLK